MANARSDRAVELVRSVMYADGPASVPPGFDNLDSPDKVRTFTRYLSRQAEREQRKVVAGDLAQATAQNPAVQQMAQDAGQGDVMPQQGTVPS